MSSKSKIQFAYLDSGIGGLPYLKYLKRVNPTARCMYVADTKNFPYGQKTRDEVIACATECVRKIIFCYEPDVIVVACNTISVAALDALRKAFPGTAFVGTVPAIKKAALLTQKHTIGLLATNRTIYDPYTTDLSKKFAADCKIIGRGDPDLVAFIEHNYLFASEKEKLEAIKPAVNYFFDCGADVIVLACTHFLNMVSYFEEYASSLGIAIVDSREGVTNRALDVERNISAITSAKKTRSWIATFNNPQDVISQELLDRHAENSAIARLKSELGEGGSDTFNASGAFGASNTPDASKVSDTFGAPNTPEASSYFGAPNNLDAFGAPNNPNNLGAPNKLDTSDTPSVPSQNSSANTSDHLIKAFENSVGTSFQTFDKNSDKNKNAGIISENGGTTKTDATSKLYITSEKIDDKWRAAYEGFCRENGMVFAGVL